MTEAVIHLDKIIETLETPKCHSCEIEMDAVYFYGYTEPEKRIKSRPNDLSAWLCKECMSAIYPVIDDEQIIFMYYDKNKDESFVIDVLENWANGNKWYSKEE